MSPRNPGTLAVALAVVATAVAALAAVTLDQALTDADGRRKAAESGLRQIKAKSQEQAEHVRALYVEAASRNSAWLASVCQAIQQGAPAAPDVKETVEPATALVQWVSARNRVLGVSELTPPLAEAVKKRVMEDLTEIANGSWKNARGANEQKRAKTASDLKDRLTWRTWEEIQ
jgi:hypothetical protein